MKPTTQRNRVKVVNNINVLGVHCLKTFISQTLPRIGMFCTIAKRQTLSCLKTFFRFRCTLFKDYNIPDITEYGNVLYYTSKRQKTLFLASVNVNSIIKIHVNSHNFLFTIPPSIKQHFFLACVNVIATIKINVNQHNFL